MKSSDKNALIGVVATLIVVCFSIVCVKGTRYLPLGWIAVISIICEFFVAALVCKKVSTIAGEPTSLWFLPIYSTVSIFQKHFMIATLVPGALLAISSFLLFANINPFGLSDIGLMLPRYLGVAECVLIAIVSIVVGLGYFDVLRQINQILRKYDRAIKAIWMNMLFLCIPLVRIVGLIQIHNASSSLLLVMRNNNLDADDYDFVEDEQ